MQPETRFGLKLDERIKRLAEKYGQEIKSYNIQQLAIRGTPDRLLCVNGFFVGLELKIDEKAKRAPLQVYEIEAIKMSGGYATFVSPENLEEVLFKIERLLRR